MAVRRWVDLSRFDGAELLIVANCPPDGKNRLAVRNYIRSDLSAFGFTKTASGVWLGGSETFKTRDLKAWFPAFDPQRDLREFDTSEFLIGYEDLDLEEADVQLDELILNAARTHAQPGLNEQARRAREAAAADVADIVAQFPPSSDLLSAEIDPSRRAQLFNWSRLPNEPASRSKALRNLLNTAKGNLDESIARYEEFRAKGLDAVSNYDILIAFGGSASFALRGSLNATRGHVRVYREQVAAFEQELEVATQAAATNESGSDDGSGTSDSSSATAESTTAADRQVYRGRLIYQTAVIDEGKLVPRFAVQTVENRNRVAAGERALGGDTLHTSLEAARAEVDWQIERDERDALSQAEDDRKAAREQEARDAARREFEDVDGFTDALAPMQKERVLQTLNGLVRYEGVAISRKALIRKKFADGYSIENDDELGIILSKDDAYLSAKQLTKTGLDYAVFLSAKRPADEVRADDSEADAASPELIAKAGDVLVDEHGEDAWFVDYDVRADNDFKVSVTVNRDQLNEGKRLVLMTEFVERVGKDAEYRRRMLSDGAQTKQGDDREMGWPTLAEMRQALVAITSDASLADAGFRLVPDGGDQSVVMYQGKRVAYLAGKPTRSALRAALVSNVNSEQDAVDVLNEVASIRRGEHPGFNGLSDRITNSDDFLWRLADEDPERAKALGSAWAGRPDMFSRESGLSPERVTQLGNQLIEQHRVALTRKATQSTKTASRQYGWADLARMLRERLAADETVAAKLPSAAGDPLEAQAVLAEAVNEVALALFTEDRIGVEDYAEIVSVKFQGPADYAVLLQDIIAMRTAALQPAAEDVSETMPSGWTESSPGGLAASADPLRGGIIDRHLASGKWFVIFNDDSIPAIEDLESRQAAFAALAAELDRRNASDQRGHIHGTPGTAIRWSNLREWMKGWKAIDNRAPSAKRHEQLASHLDALAEAMEVVESEKDAGVLAEAKRLIESLQPPRGMRAEHPTTDVLQRVGTLLNQIRNQAEKDAYRDRLAIAKDLGEANGMAVPEFSDGSTWERGDSNERTTIAVYSPLHSQKTKFSVQRFFDGKYASLTLDVPELADLAIKASTRSVFEAVGRVADAMAAEEVVWYGSRDRAEARIAMDGLSDTHEVIARGARFEIRRTAKSLMQWVEDVIDGKKDAPAQQRKNVAEGPADADDAKARVAALERRVTRFASGMSRAKDFHAATRAEHGVGVDIGQLSDAAMRELADRIVAMRSQVFVDSGAFGLFMRSMKSGDVTPMDFDAVLAKYDKLQEYIAEANPSEESVRPPLLVMPDVVGDQAESIALVARYREWIKVEAKFNASRPVIPLQRGDLSLSDAYDQVVQTLGTDQFVVGVPSNAAAITPQEFIEFLRKSKPRAVHILGALSKSRLLPRLQQIVEAGVDADIEVSADANILRSKIIEKGMTARERAARIESVLGAAALAEDFSAMLSAANREMPAGFEIRDHGDSLALYREGAPTTYAGLDRSFKAVEAALEAALGGWTDPDADEGEESPSEQFASYRSYIEKVRAEGLIDTMPGLLEQIRADERLNGGEAEKLLALANGEEDATTALTGHREGGSGSEADNGPLSIEQARAAAVAYVKWWASQEHRRSGPDDVMPGVYQGRSFQTKVGAGDGIRPGHLMVDAPLGHQFRLSDLWKDAMAASADPAATEPERKGHGAAPEPKRRGRPAKNPEKARERIEDAGEKIGGARKDFYSAALRREDLAQMNDREKSELVTKDNVWPKRSIDDYRAAGVDARVALFIQTLRREFPNAPKELKHAESFIEMAEKLRDLTAKMKGREDVKHFTDALIAAEVLQSDSTHRYRRLALREDFSEMVCAALPRGFTFTNRFLYDPDTGYQRALSNYNSKAYRIGDDWVRPRDLDSEGFYDFLTALKQRADEKRRQTIENRDSNDTDKQALVRPHLAKIVRDGLPDERGGRDIGPDDLLNDFGFRACEFGNWLPDAERQDVLNRAYDALSTLARVLDVDRKFISLDGTLALAFGSRGVGRALAHYECARKVINLTRLRGAGALAHEWWHALDDYVGGKVKAEVAERDLTRQRWLTDSYFASELFLNESRRRRSTKPDIYANWNKLPTVMEDMKPLLALVDTISTRKWSDAEVLQLVQQEFATAERNIMRTLSEILAAIQPNAPEDHYAETVKRYLDALRIEAADPEKRLGPWETHALQQAFMDHAGAGLKGNDEALHEARIASLSKQIRTYQEAFGLVQDEQLRSACEHAKKRTYTRYARDALHFDQKKATPYWSTMREMSARAFESFVQDRIEGNGWREDYLVHGTDELTNEQHIHSIYPKEGDRAAINAAMDSYFAVVREKYAAQPNMRPAARQRVA